MIKKKPNQVTAKKVSNSSLLPTVLQTDPNKKMLGSTLDVATSKGEMLPFRETMGLQNNSVYDNTFINNETNPVRKESQTNLAFVSADITDEYLGKTSYIDLYNYFETKGLPLKDNSRLDSGTLNLDLPVSTLQLTEYQQYYWLADLLPVIRIHISYDSSIVDLTQLIGKPFTSIKDDITGKIVNLETGMRLIFTGNTVDVDDPSNPGEDYYRSTVDLNNNVITQKVFYVKGAGVYTSITREDLIDQKTHAYDNNPTGEDPEYVVMDRLIGDNNPWSTINKWYHINLIKLVAEFLGISSSSLAAPANQAKRPIIQYYGNLELANWPKANPLDNNGDVIKDVRGMLTGTAADYADTSIVLEDIYGSSIISEDRLVFVNDAGIYKFNPGNSERFEQVGVASEDNGLLITGEGSGLYKKLIFKDGVWKEAQTKTYKNQAPLFEFYNMNSESISSLTNNKFTGAKILDFQDGDTYDLILDRYVDVSTVDYDITNTLNPITINSNQIKIVTDCDATLDLDYGIDEEIKGPFQFKIGNRICSFWRNRFGLNLNKDVEYITYNVEDYADFSAEIKPLRYDFNELHVFNDAENGIEFYYKIPGKGFARFTSKNSALGVEYFMPLMSGMENRIVCHSLPSPIKFFVTEVKDGENISSLNGNLEDFVSYDNISDNVTVITLTLDDTDINELTWEYDNRYNFAIARPVYKWRFLTTLYLQDKTYPIYDGYDINFTDSVDIENNPIKKITATPQMGLKATNGDKIIIESYNVNNASIDVPIGLARNPLNEDVRELSYYALYQHFVSVYSTSLYSREFQDPEKFKKTKIGPMRVGVGTLNKHSEPLARTAIMATQMPLDFVDILVKQGRHYDSFLRKFTTEIEKIVNSAENLKPHDIISLALEKIYVTTNNLSAFWSHSNMIGWGPEIDRTSDTVIVTTGTLALVGNLEPINHRAGKEFITHLIDQETGRILTRGSDYEFVSELEGYYTGITFATDMVGKTIVVNQWPADFQSRVPASLSKIGLSPVYKPEIYLDTSYSTPIYFLYRHDGTRYYLQPEEYKLDTGEIVKRQVDDSNYPVNIVDAVLYEYEKAVWSSIAYDIENNDFSQYSCRSPGGFRPSTETWPEARQIVNNDIIKWFVDNGIYDLTNTIDVIDSFKLRYSYDTGAEKIEGSWRAIYRYFYDTDRPHTHPWEMLGYTIKPSWWDEHYSWTDSAKREALQTALHSGIRGVPLYLEGKVIGGDINVHLARGLAAEEFPVDLYGNLIAPKDLQWLSDKLTYNAVDWQVGDFSDYDMAFLSTHYGVSSQASLIYLLNPTLYVTNNWVPGQTKQYAEFKLDRDSNYWLTPTIDTTQYHRSDTSGSIVYTSGIESLYAEFCILNSKDMATDVVDRFNNVSMKKEFLLSGFTNKNNVRIKSTSITNQKKNLFVPEENYDVRIVKHYPHKEIFYSGMRILWNGKNWTVNGFASERPYFEYFIPTERSGTRAIKVNNVVMNEPIEFDRTQIHRVYYGSRFFNRQELYNFIVGHGKYMESIGFVYEEPELGDIRNWQLSAKQFVFWTESNYGPGNYIDLSPAADEIILTNLVYGQLDSLEGTNNNPGLCVDRDGRPLFSKDLLVIRGDEIRIKTKDTTRQIYGIKLSFSLYESVAYLDGTSVFNDIYFVPAVGTTKRGFLVGGKRSDAWTGEYFAPGFMFSGNDIIPNFETMADSGRTMLDTVSSKLNNTVIDAARGQFGLNRNSELRQLLLADETETTFKTAITFEKGTASAFSSLSPITHSGTDTVTVPREEYMVLMGNFGDTKNVEYTEFQFVKDRMGNTDSQIVKLFDSPYVNDRYYYVRTNEFVYRPVVGNVEKTLTFESDTTYKTKILNESPLLSGDYDYTVSDLSELPLIYKELSPLFNIETYDPSRAYKSGDKFRFNGVLYQATGTISRQPAYPATMSMDAAWALASEKTQQIKEPFLPNVYVENDGTGNWQLLQLMDLNLSIIECCTGIADTSMARVSTNVAHGFSDGDQIFIVNASTEVSSANGQWTVKLSNLDLSIDATFNAATMFYIDTRIVDTIYGGKIFAFRPVKFATETQLLSSLIEASGYTWNRKLSSFGLTSPGVEDPVVSSASTTTLDINSAVNVDPAIYSSGPATTANVVKLTSTPSGFPAQQPIAVVQNESGYTVYAIVLDSNNIPTPIKLKENKLPVLTDPIESFIVYDHDAGNTVAKLELFDPKKFIIPSALASEIDLTSRIDPAKYTKSSDKLKSIYMSNAWGDDKLGVRWWDTSTLALVDYYSGSDDYKEANWGKTIDGKLPDIYEWTKSTVPPNQWSKLVDQGAEIDGQIASGQAYVDNRTGKAYYHWVEKQRTESGNTYTDYYFWVKNKNTTPFRGNDRNYTVEMLAKVVLNPSAAGFAWWAPLSSDTILVTGVKTYLNNTSTVAQIKTRKPGSISGQVHDQWLLMSNDQVNDAPEWMHIRLRDSLAGFASTPTRKSINEFPNTTGYEFEDVINYEGKYYQAVIDIKTDGSLIEFDPSKWLRLLDYTLLRATNEIEIYASIDVPNIKRLHRFNTLGNTTRPFIQSWFSDIIEARRTVLRIINSILPNINVVNILNWDFRLGNQEYAFSDKVIDMTILWNYSDYKSVDYDSEKVPVVVARTKREAFTSSADVGDYVESLDNGIIYKKIEDGGFEIVYQRNGTITFNEELFDRQATSSWDNTLWDKFAWDYDIGAVMSVLMDALRYDVLKDVHKPKYKEIMLGMLRHVLSEQTNVDWIKKATTIKPSDISGSILDQAPELERDRSDTLIEFYSSLKSYRDKFRDANINKSTNEVVNTSVSDDHEIYITLPFNRVTGDDELIPIAQKTVTGLGFVKVGWDNETWDDITWEPEESDRDYQLEALYQGGESTTVLSGYKGRKFTGFEVRQEDVVVQAADTLIIDLEQYTGPDLAYSRGSIRMYQYMNSVQYFILDNTLTALAENISYDENKEIKLTSIEHLADASLDSIQYIWINNEKIGYSIVTANGIGGIIRGAHGTLRTAHSADESVYIENAKTVLVSETFLGDLGFNAPFFNNFGKTLHESTGAYATYIRNYSINGN